ncbi:hypothetical protein [Streptomyces sp. 8L]|uniref:hypothetical protein n=1 Tax=Streptomyces sp. 8L TaxID=2877242 RepID=UPI001CD39F09|nr:hypothetical protein [Streptomyces sp. 8L]MCA1217689.1 hypothetical protein [Streptomyces sp. 8L]
MSRETDSSPSGPQGRGGSPYPSGDAPYGSRQAPGLQQDAGEESGAARKGEPRTETTLTTRIRINIPGSRPIPPVVVRTPVADGGEAADGRGTAAAARDDASDGGGERTGSTPAPGTPAMPAQNRQEPAGEPAPQPEKKTSDWFAPRKPMAAGGAMGAGAAATSGDGTQGGAGTPGSGAGAPDAGAAPGAGGTGAGTSPYSDYSDTAYSDTAYQDPYQAEGYRDDAERPGGPGVPPYGVAPVPGPGEQPNGPTTGPATGSSVLGAADGAGHGGPVPAGPGHTPPYGTPGVGAQGPGTDRDGAPAQGGAPGAGGPPRLSDDTAILTPQQFVPEPGAQGAPGAAPDGHVSGSTLSSGVPATSAEGRTAPFPGGGGRRPDLTPRLDGQGTPGAPGQDPGGPGAGPGDAPVAPAAAAPAAKPAPAKPTAKKKGRSKLVLAVVAVLVVGGGLYGAGLVMNHADVPKGTTVLGVDIGGSTKDGAVDTLEKHLGKTAAMPLKLTVGGKSQSLLPENAGLTLDDQATVEAASGPDYNPVDVVGSLFGRARPVDPVMPVDDEKLTSALTGMAQSLGSAREGTITFSTGTPVAVPGRAGTGLDVARAKQAVRDAYRNQVETGRAVAVSVPTVEQQPTISGAEIDRAMKEFAKPAMSGLVTIKASTGASIQFGQVSLPKILSMKAVDGKLVDSYDLKALKSAYGSAFDGVQVKRADGSSTAVTPQDVADQLRVALRGKTPDERVREIGEKTTGLTG